MHKLELSSQIPVHTQSTFTQIISKLGLASRIGLPFLIAAATVFFAVPQYRISSAIIFIVSILFTFIIYLYISRPIRQLSDFITKLETSRDNVSIPHFRRSDEVGTLSRALVKYSNIFQEQQTLKKQLYEQKEQILKLTSSAIFGSASLSLFLANMSHEIRTTINSVLGMADLLRETKLTKKQRFFTDTIFSSSTSLIKIINNILDFSKIEAGKLQLDPIPFSPLKTIEDVIALLGPMAEKKGLELIVQCDPKTPKQVVGDAGRIRQILTNLISNAVKFTDKGFVCVSQKSKLSSDIVTLRIEVKDSGIGIDQSKLETIFDDFTQAESSNSQDYGGTGLGLSISRKLIDIMDGRIGVSSQTGKGSTFWFEVDLPVVEPDERTITAGKEPDTGDIVSKQRIAPEPEQLPNPQNRIDVNNKQRILIADDNELNRLLLRNMIDDTSYDLSYAENGRIAADMARASEFDLILMDISMPVLDGVGAAQAIREHEKSNGWKPVPIIALTAHTIPADSVRFTNAGICDYLTKPLQKADLLRMIKNYLNDTRDKPASRPLV